MRALSGNDRRSGIHLHDFVSNCPSRQCSPSIGAVDSGPGHDFGRMSVQSPESKSMNRSEVKNDFRGDDDPIHRPLIDQFRQREHLPLSGKDPSGNPDGPTDAQIKYGGLLMSCPDSTKVANTVDLQAAGLAAGYRTAYGIHAQMAVAPDGRTWDGTAITETLTQGANTCPASLTKGNPCSGGTHPFIVGDPSGNSAVGGSRPKARNRFWDFHVTHVRPASVSVLHDKTRNPADLPACTTVCNQQYHCGGNVIGNHKITRTYRKARFKGNDVTLMDVTKT